MRGTVVVEWRACLVQSEENRSDFPSPRLPIDAISRVMANVLTEICAWAKKLPVWEQQALRCILACESFDDADYSQLADALLSERKDAVAVDFTVFEASAPDVGGEKAKLISITDVANVNALVEKQSVTFGPQLTAIFGANGSGKSGYARIFGSSCFTRGDRDVLPNMYKAGAELLPRAASITISANGNEKTLPYRFDRPVPELAAFYVFDTTCVASHLEKANTLTFSPAGLSALNELVRHTDKVREIANGRLVAATAPHDFSRLFDGGATAVSAQIGALNAATDAAALAQLATLSAEDHVRIEELEREMARLKLLDVPKAVRALRAQANLLQTARASISQLETELGDARVGELSALLHERKLRSEQAERAGAEQFAVDGLTTVGSGAWSEFLHAAKQLADGESEMGEPYPSPGAPCLLCHQPLSDESAQLLHRLWEFLKGEAKRLLAQSDSQIAQCRRAIESLGCDPITSQSALEPVLREWASESLPLLNEFLAAAAARRTNAMQAIDAALDAIPNLQPLPASLLTLLEGIETLMDARIAELQESDPSAKLTLLRREWLEFEHRRILARNLTVITEYLTKLRWATAAQKKVKDSRHITKKYNELFEARVTDRYREIFEDFLRKLGRPLKARISTRGQKGATVKVLALDLPEGVKHPKASPEHVFSEGEKRAVVLADYLTEVTLDPGSAGAILDDPVTSLDAEWKTTIASLLAEQAKERQVIVFTHDLHFLYLLRSSAKRSSVDLRAHWIRRGLADGEPGYVSLDNSPATEMDYKSSKNAQEHLLRATKAGGAEEQETWLKAGFGALRTSYEVFVMTEMFGDVMRRFDERISIDRLKDAILEPSIVETVVEKVGLLSRYIEGHSHSDAFAAVKPTVETLRTEIAEFDALRPRLKELRKQRAAKV